MISPYSLSMKWSKNHVSIFLNQARYFSSFVSV